MQSLLPKCPSCQKHYDTEQHLPKTLPKCGHSVCLKCLTKILSNPLPSCPVDKQSLSFPVTIKDFSTNFSLREILEEASNSEFCKTHNERIQFLCLEDQTKMCALCKIYSSHKDHKAESLRESDVVSTDLDNDKDDEKDGTLELFLFGFETSLEFDLTDNCLTITATDNQPKAVFYEAKSFTGIEELRLVICSRKLATSDLQAIKRVCCGITTIIKKSFIAEEKSRISEESILDIFSVLFSNAESIKEIEVSFSENRHITDESIQYLAYQVLPEIDIKSLKLYLYSTKITDKAIYALIDSVLKSMKVLKSLTLSLQNTYITDQAFQELLTSLYGIKNLELYLGETNITDKSISMFAEQMLPAMKTLNKFQLCLWNTCVTDFSIIKLLANFGYVKKFMLNIGETYVTDKGFEALANNLLRVTQNLEEFAIDCEGSGVSNNMAQLIGQIQQKIIS